MTPPEDTQPEELLTAEAIGAAVKGKGIYAKIAAVQHHVGSVSKTGKVSFGNTKFAHMQEHGLIEVLRPLWRACGLAVIPGGFNPGGFRREANTYIVDMGITIADTEPAPEGVPQSIDRYFPNVGVDNADKGMNKAYTGAVKYALQKVFLVPTEGIDDNETVISQSGQMSPAPTPPARPANTAPQQAIEEVRAALLKAHQSGLVPASMSKDYIVGKYQKSLDQLDPTELADVATWLTHAEADAEAARG